MTTMTPEQAAGPAADDRIVAVTSDSHVGPLLREQLRDYCPKRYLAAFDEFVAFAETLPKRLTGPDPDEDPRHSHLRNVLTTGGWDPHERLRDMDREGIAAEVIFHGLNTGRQDFLPFNGPFGAYGLPGYDNELVGLGRHIYNQWLTDFVSVEPERHAGLAHLPMWDPDAAVKELEWAAQQGLRGVNFPRPQAGIPPYNDPVWERFWSACEDLNMPLTTHAQGQGPPVMSHPGDFEIYMLEIMGDNGRRALHELIFGGVFERHPKLKLVYTEVLDRWWTEALAQMDDMAEFFWHRDGQRRPSQRVHAGPHGLAKLPHLPSYYCRRSLFIGWTTLAPFEAQDAVDHEYDSQVLWGSDYPHPEGSYQYPRADDEVPITRLHLRDTFAGIPRERAAAMIGGNAIRVYGFDQAKLQGVADRINSMTFTELGTPLDEEPEDFVTRSAAFCFRRSGAYN